MLHHVLALAPRVQPKQLRVGPHRNSATLGLPPAQIDEAVDELQQAKGDGAGATVGAHCEAATLAAEGLRLRSEMARAAEEER